MVIVLLLSYCNFLNMLYSLLYISGHQFDCISVCISRQIHISFMKHNMFILVCNGELSSKHFVHFYSTKFILDTNRPGCLMVLKFDIVYLNLVSIFHLLQIRVTRRHSSLQTCTTVWKFVLVCQRARFPPVSCKGGLLDVMSFSF